MDVQMGWKERRADELEETETIPCTVADNEDATAQCLTSPYHMIMRE